MQQQTNISQNQQSQQTIMSQPPSLITTKDQLYLSDMLSWNLLAMKKAHFFAQQCQDQEIKQTLENAGMMHQRHYQTILSHLNTTNPQPSIPVQ
ncbi:hypothetical protein [Bacillus suaedae]|uniref:Ferritin-like domain-containing protein n=1 Tax=Halalkalibacter suaedae TaxID=2822140 RepID=A0A941AN50_9BACI|nr:hypothetical protein [Bacillus suaedae]MBP3949932.1 hypothetical protein [Bacillus suaedae]